MSLSVQPFAASSAPSTTASSVVVRSSVVSVYDDLHCAECNTGDHIIVDYHTGTNICTECGMVIGGQIISEESEWRSFSDGDKKRGSDPNRVGGPDNPNLGDGTLATMIGRDSDGMVSALSKYQNAASLSAQHRLLLQGYRVANRFASQLNLPQAIIERSNDLFKRVEESKQLKNRKLEAVVTACLFIACKMEGVPRTFKELCAVCGVNARDVGRCFSKIKKLKLHKKAGEKLAPSSSLVTSTLNTLPAQPTSEIVKNEADGVGAMSAATTGDTVSTSSTAVENTDLYSSMSRFCSRLQLHTVLPRDRINTLIYAAIQLVETASRHNIAAGIHGASLNSAALYMVVNVNAAAMAAAASAEASQTPATVLSTYGRSYKDIAEACFVNANTVKQVVQRLWPHRTLLVPSTLAGAEHIQNFSP